MFKQLTRFPLEALVWAFGLAALAFADASSPHLTICPLAIAEVDWCPGCGLGRSVSFLMHGEVRASMQAHPLGWFAVIVLGSRIFRLLRTYTQNYGKNY